MQTFRQFILAHDLFRPESEPLLPLSTWIALTDRVGLDGVKVEADVPRCRISLDPIAP